MSTKQDSKCVCVVPRAERIARLNDQLRVARTGGQTLITAGVEALTGGDHSELLKVLARYDDFDAANDPHGERDFGAIDFLGAELLWKIDYYSDADLCFGSDDPADPEQTQRVLTIMLAEEY